MKQLFIPLIRWAKGLKVFQSKLNAPKRPYPERGIKPVTGFAISCCYFQVRLPIIDLVVYIMQKSLRV